MNDLGKTKYGEDGVIIPNIKRKEAARKALAAITETIPKDQISYGVVKDILSLADEIAYFRPLQ